MLSSRTVASVALLQFGLASLYNTSSAPVSWVVCSLSVWFSFLAARGWARLSTWDRYQLAWALGSTGAFFNFVTVLDPEFKVSAPGASLALAAPAVLPLQACSAVLVHLLVHERGTQQRSLFKAGEGASSVSVHVLLLSLLWAACRVGETFTTSVETRCCTVPVRCAGTCMAGPKPAFFGTLSSQLLLAYRS